MNMRRKSDELLLHEQMLLLILRDREGTVESKAGMHRIALGGAILSELYLSGRIAIDPGRGKQVTVTSTDSLGDELLDEALARMAAAKRPRGAQAWVTSLAGIKRLRHRIAEGLCRRKILKDSEDTVLLFFKRKAYPTINPLPERRLLGEMRAAVTGSSTAVGPRIGILVALAHAAGTLRAHFDRRMLRQHHKRIEKIASGDLVGNATQEAVQAAVMAAVAAATVTTSTTAR
jgi:hypothetical protein